MLICGRRTAGVVVDEETVVDVTAAEVGGDDGALRDIIADGVPQADAGRDGNIASI